MSNTPTQPAFAGPAGSANPCQTIEECLEWAECGEMCCGIRTERSIKTLAAEVRRLQAMLRAIAKFGQANPGYGFSCARMAEDALRVPPNATGSATGENEKAQNHE